DPKRTTGTQALQEFKQTRQGTTDQPQSPAKTAPLVPTETPESESPAKPENSAATIKSEEPPVSEESTRPTVPPPQDVWTLPPAPETPKADSTGDPTPSQTES